MNDGYVIMYIVSGYIIVCILIQVVWLTYQVKTDGKLCSKVHNESDTSNISNVLNVIKRLHSFDYV